MAPYIKSRILRILLLPVLALIFLIGLVMVTYGNKKQNKVKGEPLQKKRKNGNSTDNIQLELIPQEELQTQ